MAASSKMQRLIVTLEAQNDKFISALETANRSIARFERQQTKSIDAVSAGFKALGGVLAGISFAGMAKSAIDTNNHLDDMSTRLGITTEALTRLHYAAELTGVSTDQLDDGLRSMISKVSEAANGTGEAAAALQELGINAKALEQLAPEDQFKRLADALNGVEQASDRVRLAQKLFEEGGTALLQTMNGGAAALEEYARQADRFGRTVSTETAKAATEFNANLVQTKALLTGITNDILGRVLPTFNRFARLLKMALDPGDGDELVKQLWATENAIKKIQMELDRWKGRSSSTMEFDIYLAKLEAEKERLQHVYDVLQEKIGGAHPVGTGVAADIKIPAMKPERPKTYEDVFEKEAQKASALAQQQRQLAESRLEYIRMSLLSEEESLQESYDRRQAIIEDAVKRQLTTQENADRLAARNKQQFEEAMTEVQQREGRARVSAASDMFGNLAALSESAQGRASALHKTAAISQATIAGIVATQEALRGPPGPPWSFALAASVAAMAAANVSKIAGTRASGGPVSGGKSYLVGERGPELFVAPTSGQIVPNHALQGGGEVTVNIVEDASRAGQVTRVGDMIEIAVAAATSRIADDMRRGRGVGSLRGRGGVGA